nr:coiled-coil domain-containing protein 130 homolog [Onthophagus taurus]
MGERKGTNKYYPPDYDPKAGGLNKWQGTHALRERARKISQGIIIIRFEMPYNIWCEGCNNHIGMGVRYNAEKTKVGMYYTTPVYQFKMKCHLCDNHFVIKTDPGNLDYIILSGARRQENRWDPLKNEQIVPETKEVQKRLFDDSMFKLEHQSDDKSIAESTKPRLAKLFSRNEDVWGDVYTANQKLRGEFRKKSAEIKKNYMADKNILSKYGLNIPLLPEKEEDERIASLLCMKLTPSKDIKETTEIARKEIISRSSLPTSNFNNLKEQKALKILNNDSFKLLGLVRKSSQKVDSKTSNDQSSTSLTQKDPVEVPAKKSKTDQVNVDAKSMKQKSLVGYECESSESETAD